MSENPGLDCLGPGHLLIKINADPAETEAADACWCVWCGTATYNHQVIDPENDDTEDFTIRTHGDWNGHGHQPQH